MQSGAGAGSLRYRPDIDGLRAIAVLLVVGFHAFPSVVTGGYIGVDIFFVVSGFLITGLLLHDLENKKFSFLGFYARRIRRIFPALFVVLAACFLAGWILLLPQEFSSLGLNISGGAAFSSNLIQFGQAGYFDLSAAQKPLLHLWSLGVEEQFYIVWPLLMLLAFSRRLSLVVVFTGLLVLSFVWNAKTLGSAADFYLPLTRAWELGIGGVIAAFTSKSETIRLRAALAGLGVVRIVNMPKRLLTILSNRNLRSAVGAALIGIAAVHLNRGSAFPGYWAILPTLGATLIVLAEGTWLNSVLLANPAVVYVGLISYPLYLWHWPLLSFATIAAPAGVSPELRGAAIVCAFGLAWLTYRCIERPIRTGHRLPLKVACLCVAMSGIGTAGLAAFEWQGFPQRIPPAIRDITTIPVNEVADWRLHTCFLDGDEARFGANCVEHGRHPLLFLWGDSYAASLYPGLKYLQAVANFGLAQYTTAGCPPLLDFPVDGRPHCVGNDDFVFSALSNVRPDVVLLFSAWNYGDVFPSLRGLIAKLRALQISHIVVMGPPPYWDGGLPKAAYDYYRADPLHRMLPLQSSFRVSNSWYGYEQGFRAKVQSMELDYISTWDALCHGKECRTRPTDDASQLMAFDYGHLTVPGAIHLANAIGPCLFKSHDSSGVVSGTDLSTACYSHGRKLNDSRQP